jgi:predicted esterase
VAEFLLVNAPDEYFGGYSWFDYPDNMAPGNFAQPEIAFELLDDLRAKNFPAEQITLGGFSQGCLMAIDVGLRYPHRLAGIVGISGWVFEIEKLLERNFRPSRRSNVARHARPFDPIIPFDPVRGKSNN